MITSNTSPTGELDTDAFRIAMLQYRNTPDPTTKLSPAMCVFGRPIKDFIPVLPGRYQPHPTWQDTLNKREEALRHRHMKAEERWAEHTKRLPPLQVGHTVRIQNQVGPHPNKWDKTGTIIEVRQFDQYVVRVDGSGRATLRNRKFLRRYVPVQQPRRPTTITDDIPQRTPSPFAPPTAPSTASPGDPTPPPVTTLSNDSREQPMHILHLRTMHEHPTTEPTPLNTHSAPTQALPPPTPSTPARKKTPLALRRLASHNAEGRKGLGEYTPTE